MNDLEFALYRHDFNKPNEAWSKICLREDPLAMQKYEKELARWTKERDSILEGAKERI